MLTELVDTKLNRVICTADILFGLDTLLVEACSNGNPAELDRFLMARSELLHKYEMDQVVYDFLGLSHRMYEFGRASDAKVLYAMLHNFERPDDAIRLYPLKTEYVSMIALDARFSNVYLWKCRKESNNVFNEKK